MPFRPPAHRPPRPQAPDGRPSAAARGYGANWRRLRLLVLAAHPVCQECGRAEARHVDHVVSLERGGTNDLDNLRALCASCHSKKTVACDGGLGHAPRKVARGHQTGAIDHTQREQR